MRWLLAILIVLAPLSRAHAAAAVVAEPGPTGPFELAITVDDLPLNGEDLPDLTRLQIVNQFLATFRKHKLVQVYGFVNALKVEQRPDTFAVLKAWVDGGHFLGNHTWSHPALDAVGAAEYIRDIQADEKVLASLLPEKIFKMFRFPFLSEGNTLPKRDAVRKYLADNRYVIAPVTLDYQDWLWTPPYERCRAKRDASAVGALKTSYLKAAGNALSLARRSSQLAFGRGIPQILLVHLNAFTATQLDQVLTEYEARGAKWVTLGEALKDPAYRVDPATAWPNGKDFLSSVIEARELSYPAHVPPPATELEMTCR